MLNKAYVIGDIAHFKPAMPKPINNAMPKPASNAMPKAQRLNDALKHLYVKPQWQKQPNDYGPFSFPKPIPLGGYGITDNVASNPTSNTMPKPTGFQDTPEPQNFTKEQILQPNNTGQRNKMAMDPGYNPHYRPDKTTDAERRISENSNTSDKDRYTFPQSLATALSATQQSGLPPAEFIRRLCGALGLDEEDIKKTQNVVGEVCSHKARPEAVTVEYQLLPMSLLTTEVLKQCDLPKNIRKYLHLNDRGVLLLRCKRNSDGKWVPVLIPEDWFIQMLEKEEATGKDAHRAFSNQWISGSK